MFTAAVTAKPASTATPPAIRRGCPPSAPATVTAPASSAVPANSVPNTGFTITRFTPRITVTASAAGRRRRAGSTATENAR
jgi:hypothetical protein